ncbi:putative sulfate/molybdate transporter [Desulfotalea psychrophila]|uniref:Probable sulfate permease (SulP) n=1 Tax=Desulfotalea psychrophila (strain LSv54 / DSM 12343) TaxID=177439 RepID=Q6ARK8_DESPS|nr:putative sulfate/molybdate transporter [Desulfotalea psychrophila]CAG35017.1 probable sulfate permease (SulP) [Desulfotalea psychrophila LSv54]
MSHRFAYNRMELAGSLGDLGTLLPITIAMILVVGLHPTGIFISIGLFYILSGSYFGITVPVQPMKVVGAYAIATGMQPSQLVASTLLMGVLLLIIGATGAIETIRRQTDTSVIRGIQLSTGVMLMTGGVKFIMGTSNLQIMQNAVEPSLILQAIGPIPISIILGILASLITFLLLDSRRFPAALMVILAGFTTGITLGRGIDIGVGNLGFHLPQILPFGIPALPDFTFALFILVLPQLPMTLGNAVLAYTDLSHKYFGEKAARVSNRKVCISMGLANVLSFFVGGMPLCHGAGGLAAHYRFGARTAGSNIFIGLFFLLVAIIFGDKSVQLLNLLPLSILGALLLFAGVQLALTIMDLKRREDYFVATIMLGITLASNLAAGFIAGIIIAKCLKWERFSI